MGRGISAGQGKTAGRGTKGEGARRGKGGSLYRQGAQLPFYRACLSSAALRISTAWNSPRSTLDKLGDFEAGAEVDPEALMEAGLVRGGNKRPIALLGRGEIAQALTIKVHRASKTAIAKVEAAGGKVEILEG